MSTQQKSALYQLFFGLASVALYAGLRIAVSAKVAPAAFAILAPIGLVPFLFRHEVADERERYLARNALVVGYTASYLFVFAMCMGAWFSGFLRGETQVDIDLLPLIAVGTCATFLIVRAAVLLLIAPRAVDLSR
ncbi:hypothetical protein FJ251_07560 [bacterium]|nr:hypothetical protein [bacterium]